MLNDKKIAILGAGNMGRAIAKGLVQSGLDPARLHATDKLPETATAFTQATGIECVASPYLAALDADVILICVKPKDVKGILQELRGTRALAQKPLLISIAAGITTEVLEEAAGGVCPVVRVMPNTPAAIGKGMTVGCKGSHATDEHIELARAIFTPLGRFLEGEERLMDAVTGLSGSGPAYVYLIIEALADGGLRQGLPRAMALELAAQTVAGAAEMVLSTGRHPAVLKDEVTTPAGTTIAGLAALEDGNLRATLSNAVAAATKRSAELGKA